MKNHAENVHQKVVPGSVLVLVSYTKQPVDAMNYFKNNILKEDIIKKSLKS